MVSDAMAEPAKRAVDFDGRLITEQPSKLSGGGAAIAAAVMRAKKLQVSRSEHALGS